jgi:3-hydroxy acid dehydrogenase/malonic semialdehyde reductase
MPRSLDGRTALVTGASSGIGDATARLLAREGARLLLAARRFDRLERLATDLAAEHGVETRALALDTTDRAAALGVVDALPAEWRAIDILVNNAGKAVGLSKLHEGDVDDWEEMLDTNVKGLLYVDRAVIPGMVAQGSGHVVHVGSVAGHEVYPGGNVYCATKSAVDALTRALRIDLNGTGVRVSTVDPGLVETEFSLVRFKGDAGRAALPYRGIDPLTPADVAEVILFIVTRPRHVQVAEVILLAGDQASARDFHRRPEG